MLKRTYLFVFVFLSLTKPVYCQESDSSLFTMFLLGDAGKRTVASMPYADTLRWQIKNCNTPSVFIFLGDNIYPAGMPPVGDAFRSEAEEILQAQIQIAVPDKTDHQIYFVPGNHDWKEGDADGFERLTEAQQWFASKAFKNVSLVPQNGCPGPIERPLTDSATLILIDTQWFLHAGKKGRASDCGTSTTQEAIAALDTMFTRNKGKQIIVAAHHPMFTYGNHGGVFSLRQHIFPLTDWKKSLYIPLPIIGSLYPLYRKYVGHVQDVAHPRNKAMRDPIIAILEKHPGTIYVSGHDHALQYIFKREVHYVVSGTGVNSNCVRRKRYAKFASREFGFAKITWLKNGVREVEYFSADEHNRVRQVFKLQLSK